MNKHISQTLHNLAVAQIKTDWKHIVQEADGDHIYAFALGMVNQPVGFFSSAQTLEALNKKWSHGPFKHETALIWHISEWNYTGIEDNSIHDFIQSLEISDDAHDQFMKSYETTLVAALKSCIQEGLFKQDERPLPIFYIQYADASDEDIDNRTSKLLNTPDIHNQFVARWEAHADNLTQVIIQKLNTIYPWQHWRSSIQKRPGMYLGYTDIRGFVSALKNTCSYAYVQLQCRDIEIYLKENSICEISLFSLKTPIPSSIAEITNLDNEGLLDLAVLNALSQEFNITFIDQNNTEIKSIKYTYGHSDFQDKTEDISCGSIKVQFQLDNKIWGEDFLWNHHYVYSKVEDFSHLHKNLKVRTHSYIENQPISNSYFSPNGLKDKLEAEALNGVGHCLLKQYHTKCFKGFSIELAFAFRSTNLDQGVVKTYVNKEYTPNNGTHFTSIVSGIQNALCQYIEIEHSSKTDHLSVEQITGRMICFLNIELNEPNYAGSVKHELLNEEIIKPLSEYISDIFLKALRDDKDQTEELLKSLSYE